MYVSVRFIHSVVIVTSPTPWLLYVYVATPLLSVVIVAKTISPFLKTTFKPPIGILLLSYKVAVKVQLSLS